MNKSELIHALAEANGISPDLAKLLVETAVAMMKQQLMDDGRVEIRGFGAFTMREYAGYKGRNPKAGTAVAVKPKRLPFFKCGKELREMVNGE